MCRDCGIFLGIFTYIFPVNVSISLCKKYKQTNTNDPAHDKTKKMACAPSKDRSAWADQSLRCPHDESLGP